MKYKLLVIIAFTLLCCYQSNAEEGEIVTISVTGWVNKPASYKISKENANLWNAIQQAGGINKRIASIRQRGVKVSNYLTDKDGNKIPYVYTFKPSSRTARGGKAMTQKQLLELLKLVQLKDGDVIYISERYH